mmetsp:Transcript_8833/g.12905  ORF Transcript_8833/g.12905 Transcript_8833/m.12905 type:complete len:121 (+) Transcript_8833:148-510(+)
MAIKRADCRETHSPSKKENTLRTPQTVHRVDGSLCSCTEIGTTRYSATATRKSLLWVQPGFDDEQTVLRAFVRALRTESNPLRWWASRARSAAEQCSIYIWPRRRHFASNCGVHEFSGGS